MNSRTTLPSEPVAAVIREMQTRGEIETDPALVARWLGWSRPTVVGMLNGVFRELSVAQIADVCEALHCSPYALWGAELGREILDVYGPESWPRYIEPLDDRAHPSKFVGRRLDQRAPEIVESERRTTRDSARPRVGLRLVEEWQSIAQVAPAVPVIAPPDPPAA